MKIKFELELHWRFFSKSSRNQLLNLSKFDFENFQYFILKYFFDIVLNWYYWFRLVLIRYGVDFDYISIRFRLGFDFNSILIQFRLNFKPISIPLFSIFFDTILIRFHFSLWKSPEFLLEILSTSLWNIILRISLRRFFFEILQDFVSKSFEILILNLLGLHFEIFGHFISKSFKISLLNSQIFFINLSGYHFV